MNICPVCFPHGVAISCHPREPITHDKCWLHGGTMAQISIGRVPPIALQSPALTESRVIELIREELRHPQQGQWVPYCLYQSWHDRNMRADRLLAEARKYVTVRETECTNCADAKAAGAECCEAFGKRIDAYFRNEPDGE